MPPPTRHRAEPTDDWRQLELLARDPAQRTYELIRPVVLFGRSPAERARETGTAERTLRRQADRFDSRGMAALLPPSEEERGRRLPTAVRQAILALKAEHPPLGPYEIAGIVAVRFDHPVSYHTVQRLLAEAPPPVAQRRFAPFHAIADPTERRLAIIRLHSEGWTVTAIAEYLQTSRKTVYATLRRWIDEGVADLDDKSRAPKRRVRTVTLATMVTVRDLQENPELGEWRVHAALKQLGIDVSPRTYGRILARNRALYGLDKPRRSPHAPKPMPFQAARRHQYWTVDLRYLDMHQLGGGHIYVISVLDNYSRAILASGVSRQQDVSAYLIVLHAALRQFGAPEAVVSDGGGIFKAKQVLAIYEALGVRREQIDRRQAWQSYIETQFNVMRRMADWHVAHATTWAELLAVHDQWVVDFNYQPHWAHRERADGKGSPAAVLGWVRGAVVEPAALHRAFFATRSGRRLDRHGYARFRHWRVYGEHGLRGEPVAVWLYGEHLSLEYRDEVLSHFTVGYEPGGRRLRTVEAPQVFETAYRSPQLALWELTDDEWRKAVPSAPSAHRRRARPAPAHQAALFA
jgi:putative transposase